MPRKKREEMLPSTVHQGTPVDDSCNILLKESLLMATLLLYFKRTPTTAACFKTGTVVTRNVCSPMLTHRIWFSLISNFLHPQSHL